MSGLAPYLSVAVVATSVLQANSMVSYLAFAENVLNTGSVSTGVGVGVGSGDEELPPLDPLPDPEPLEPPLDPPPPGVGVDGLGSGAGGLGDGGVVQFGQVPT